MGAVTCLCERLQVPYGGARQSLTILARMTELPRGRVPACRLVRGREVRVELLADLHHLLAREAAAGGEFGDRCEVVVLSTRQAPVEHACRRVADVREAVHHVARDEDEGAGAGRRRLVPD